MKLKDLLSKIKAQLHVEWEKNGSYQEAEDKDEFINSLITDMNVFELLTMLEYID